MAKVTGSPYGSVKGECLGVVGGSWKGIDYVRKYVIPANPDTVSQQTQRGKFKNIAEVGAQINDIALKPYTLPAPKKQSPYNVFLSRNVKLQSSETYDPAELVVVTGGLSNAINIVNTVKTTSAITFTWDTTLVGSASNNDKIQILRYWRQGQQWAISEVLRSAAGWTSAATRVSGDDFDFYIFAVSESGLITSSSAYTMVTIA